MKTEANARDSDGGKLLSRLARIEDGSVLRVAFYALLAGTAGILYVDFRDMQANAPSALLETPQPILPPATTPDGDGGERPAITTSPDVLGAPLEVVLESGGVLRLTGTIDPGSAERFATEIAARGEYVERVVLDSPGGSVDDALAMGQLIHEQGLSTSVPSGMLCASSCPIIFASGKERLAGRDAAIGVHQIYAAALSADNVDALRVAGVAMSDAQSTTAVITRHLTETGVDPALWLHALETPPERLYYFSADEMQALNLVTAWLDD